MIRSEPLASSFGAPHADKNPPDWEQQLESWLHQLAKPRAIFD